MTRHTSTAFLVATLLILREDSPKPPSAKVFPKTLTQHGQVRTDNYYWLRERDNPEVLAYLKAENAYTQIMMRHTMDLQAKLVDELEQRITQEGRSRPRWQDGYYYYTRFRAGHAYPF